MFWGLRLGGAPLVAPRHTVPVADVVVPPADLTRLFGAEPVAPPPDTPAASPLASRFQLLGVVAPRGALQPAVALIAVDGNPPRAYRIGSAIDGDLVLQSVEPRAASLGPQGGSAAVRLELPPPPMANTGSLPPPMPMDGMPAHGGRPPLPMQAPQQMQPPQQEAVEEAPPPQPAGEVPVAR